MIAGPLIWKLNLAIAFLGLGFAAELASAQPYNADPSSVKFTTLYSFDGTDGANPQTALVQATNGELYGTTLGELLPPCVPGGVCGTVFKISPSGELTSLHRFCTQNGCPDGEL